MNSLTLFLLFIPILALILLMVNFILGIHKPNKDKDSQFECGFTSFVQMSRMPFNISFFIYALLFLLFDLEILLVYPYVISAYNNDMYGLIVILIFFVLLTTGFIYELGNKALEIYSRQTYNISSGYRLFSLASLKNIWKKNRQIICSYLCIFFIIIFFFIFRLYTYKEVQILCNGLGALSLCSIYGCLLDIFRIYLINKTKGTNMRLVYYIKSFFITLIIILLGSPGFIITYYVIWLPLPHQIISCDSWTFTPVAQQQLNRGYVNKFSILHDMNVEGINQPVATEIVQNILGIGINRVTSLSSHHLPPEVKNFLVDYFYDREPERYENAIIKGEFKSYKATISKTITNGLMQLK